jgi:hypothetical protein
MKTIANCNPVEFLRQTNKIRHQAGDLLTKCKIAEIRKHVPEFTGDETAEEKKAKIEAQAKINMNDMLDALMDENAEKTAEFLGLMCFVEPEDIANYTGVDFVTPAAEILANKNVMDFLLSLVKLGQTNMVA